MVIATCQNLKASSIERDQREVTYSKYPFLAPYFEDYETARGDEFIPAGVFLEHISKMLDPRIVPYYENIIGGLHSDKVLKLFYASHPAGSERSFAIKIANQSSLCLLNEVVVIKDSNLQPEEAYQRQLYHLYLRLYQKSHLDMLSKIASKESDSLASMALNSLKQLRCEIPEVLR